MADIRPSLPEIWPENEDSWELFKQVRTQWRTGANGATGLDYNVTFRLMDRMNLSGDDWDRVFDDLRVMEAAAIKAMNRDNA